MTNESIEQVRAAQRGDPKAFTQLVAEYQHQACRLAFALLEEADTAEDIAQESFIEAWQQLHRLDDPAKFGPWLNTVVRNRALNQRRQDSRRSKREGAFGIAAETDPSTPESDADQAQRAAA
ncbi:MAG: sigma-70 family RNA polymerase sigma factor, partial [Myxococcota bacterium]